MKEISLHRPKLRIRPYLILFGMIAVAVGIAAVFWDLHTKSEPGSKAEPAASQATLPPSAEADSIAPNTSEVGNLQATERDATIATQNTTNVAASLEEWIKIIKDTTQPLKARIKAAQALAANGSPAAMIAIKEALKDGPAELRAAIAEALGSCPNPESYYLMVGLLSDPDEMVAAKAACGLGHQDTWQSASILSQTLYNPAVPLNVRCEAALALGTQNQPGTLDLLTHAATTIPDEAVVTQILNALGARPFDDTKGFFDNYLKSPTTSQELKIAAIEALGNAQGDPSSLLMNFANNADPEQRASAAWALSTANAPGAVQDQLLAWLKNENDPNVRLRLYQALGNQEMLNTPAIQALVRDETAPAARTAGFDLLAGIVANNPSPELASYFDVSGVPYLQSMALNGATPSDRMGAVIALKRAHTPGAFAALQALATQAQDPRVRQSAQRTPASQATGLPY